MYSTLDYVRASLSIPLGIAALVLALLHAKTCVLFTWGYFSNDAMPLWVRWLMWCWILSLTLHPRKHAPNA